MTPAFPPRFAAIGILVLVLVGVSGCGPDTTGGGATADTPTLFSTVPDACGPIIADIAPQIARFTGDLYDPDVVFEPGGVDDPPRTETLTCSGTYTRSGNEVPDSTTGQVKLRRVYLGLTVTTGDQGLGPGDRLRASEESFVRARPENYSPCEGIGEDCYIVTETGPGIASTVLHFRSRNLDGLVRLSTAYRQDDPEPDPAADRVNAHEIAQLLVDDLEDLIPR